jgi:hypothetical protein
MGSNLQILSAWEFVAAWTNIWVVASELQSTTVSSPDGISHDSTESSTFHFVQSSGGSSTGRSDLSRQMSDQQGAADLRYLRYFEDEQHDLQTFVHRLLYL